MEANSIFQRWDDLVFENRNKMYGAYPLRQHYPDRVFVGLMITMATTALLLSLRSARPLDVKDVIPPVVFDGSILIQRPPVLPKRRLTETVVPRRQEPRRRTILVTREEVVEPEQEEAIAAFVEGSDVGSGAPVFAEGEFDGLGELPALVEETNEPVIYAELMPSYEGGMEAMMKFIQKRIKYPRSARSLEIEGTVYVRFVVNGDGTVSNVEVLRGFHRDCDEEAVRVISMLPAWKGGKHNGRPVPVRMVLPIKFNLHQ